MRTSRTISWFSLLALLLALASCQRISSAIAGRASNPASADPARVSLNKRSLPAQKIPAFRFLVIGHGYGSTTLDDHLPDRALLEKLPEIKTMDLSMMVSLGDIVQHSIAEDFDNLDSRLLDPLPFPVFNIPGNHDVVNRQVYESRYGQTYYSFRAGSAQMVFLDTERESCAIDAPQQDMLTKVIPAAAKDDRVKNLFIFMHKTLFFRNERLAGLNQKQSLPNVMECYGKNSFDGILEKTILPAAQKKPVYLFAGDVGAWGNLSPYYEKRPDAALTMLMTGLGDQPNDSGILVAVDGGSVKLEVYPLNGQAMQPLESYTPEYWIQQAGQN